MIRRWRERQIRKLVEYIDWDPETDTLVLCTEMALGHKEVAALHEQFYAIVQQEHVPRIAVVTNGIRFVVVRGLQDKATGNIWSDHPGTRGKAS